MDPIFSLHALIHPSAALPVTMPTVSAIPALWQQDGSAGSPSSPRKTPPRACCGWR